MVARAKNPDDPGRRAALEQLIQSYWKPIYVFVRQRGHQSDDAKDITQGFMLYLMESPLLERVERLGRFKNYLLTALDYYLSNSYRKSRAEKRGGGRVFSVDLSAPEIQALEGMPLSGTPEQAFNRSWELTTLQRAMQAMRTEYEQRDPRRAEVLRRYFSGETPRPSYQQLADQQELSLSQVTNLIHQAKKRLEELIRAELSRTVNSTEDLEQELRELFEAVGPTV